MIYTNKRGLPQVYCRAVERQKYNNEGTLSTTTMIRPPQMVKLENKHWDEIEVDVEDQLWMLDGNADHYLLELAKEDTDFVEFRLFWEIDGIEISGKPDLLTANGVLVDHKRTSVWAIKDALKKNKPEWEQQMNVNAELIRLNNDFLTWAGGKTLPEPKRLAILARARDWRPSEARKYDDYPHKIEVINMPLWSRDKCIEFIHERVKLFSMEAPIPCTPEERYAVLEQWAVMGKSKALRLLSSEDEAKAWAEGKGIDKPRIEFRPGDLFKRCREYCAVSKFCEQYQESKSEKQL